MADRDKWTAVVEEDTARSSRALTRENRAGRSSSLGATGLGRDREPSWEIMSKASVDRPPVRQPVDVYRYFWKPPFVTFGGGLLGILLIGGQFWVESYLAALGIDLGILLPLLRVVMVLAGIFMLIIATPVYRPIDWTPDQDFQDKRDPDLYRSKPLT